jgi:glycosyltransferase involved in cell wall biosynthesis
MARLLMQALDRAGYPVFLASDWRTYDGKGDAQIQRDMLAFAPQEAARVVAVTRPKLWFTYHCYYKAPDLIGPRVAGTLGIPYVIAEASRAKKRLGGKWDAFAQAAESAIDAADALFAMTAHDRFALDRDRSGGQRVLNLPPFLDTSEFSPRQETRTEGPLRLLTVAMMRPGAKMESYRRLAAALPHIRQAYHLTIIGYGSEHTEVEALFPDASFKGELDEEALRHEYVKADLFVWPGVDEAYGMVYLEAQASGLPVVAEDHPGPRSVVAAPLVPTNDPVAFAAAIEGTHADPRTVTVANHGIDRAAALLRETLGEMPCG